MLFAHPRKNAGCPWCLAFGHQGSKTPSFAHFAPIFIDCHPERSAAKSKDLRLLFAHPRKTPGAPGASLLGTRDRRHHPSRILRQYLLTVILSGAQRSRRTCGCFSPIPEKTPGAPGASLLGTRDRRHHPSRILRQYLLTVILSGAQRSRRTCGCFSPIPEKTPGAPGASLLGTRDRRHHPSRILRQYLLTVILSGAQRSRRTCGCFSPIPEKTPGAPGASLLGTRDRRHHPSRILRQYLLTVILSAAQRSRRTCGCFSPISEKTPRAPSITLPGSPATGLRRWGGW